MQTLFSLLTASSFCWFLASSLWIYPHSLSYFNESMGGPLNGPEHLLGSNIDWGQDLRYLLFYQSEGLHKDKLYLAYFGPSNPYHLGLQFNCVPSVEPSNIYQLSPGLYVISSNIIKGYPVNSFDGSGARKFYSRGSLIPFNDLEKTKRLTYSLHARRL